LATTLLAAIVGDTLFLSPAASFKIGYPGTFLPSASSSSKACSPASLPACSGRPRACRASRGRQGGAPDCRKDRERVP
jgi:hypothetical protein